MNSQKPCDRCNDTGKVVLELTPFGKPLPACHLCAPPKEPEPRHTVARIKEMRAVNRWLAIEPIDPDWLWCIKCGAEANNGVESSGDRCGNCITGTFRVPEPECGTCGDRKEVVTSVTFEGPWYDPCLACQPSGEAGE